MKDLQTRARSTATYRTLVLAAALGVLLVTMPLVSTAGLQMTAITITNNSGLTIRHVYLSPVDQNNWGPDQLNNSVIGPGGSVTINATCQGSVKVIGEDQDGCFLSTVVSCTGSASWTIANNATRDCD
jgi:hypothetical protein